MVNNSLASFKLGDIFAFYTYARDFFISLGINEIDTGLSLKKFVADLEFELLDNAGLDREQIIENFVSFINKMEELKKDTSDAVESITILGGKDKLGNEEQLNLELRVGEVVSIVGPTGSGKSRLLADIECLAQRDTPTGRQILLNGKVPGIDRRYSIENKLIAQLSQNMNFVMDLSAREFIGFHAESRMIENIDLSVAKIVSCANDLAGEKFGPDTPLTQLSGGQSRALMIADTALLSPSPVVLIDEIENAGIDRKKAIELLIKEEKLVLISTHDPVLALMGDKRLVVKNGGIDKIIILSPEEKRYIDVLEEMDNKMLEIRDHLRKGGIIDASIC